MKIRDGFSDFAKMIFRTGRLLADIHHPKGLEKTPAILVRIPFTKTFWKSSPIGRRRALLGVPWIYGCGSGNARQI